MATVLTLEGRYDVRPVRAGEDCLWLTVEDVYRVTGFELKPEGLCRDELCVPVRHGTAAFAVDGEVDVVGFWRHLGHPVVSDRDGATWVLGLGDGTRRQQFETLEAPDFKLPDLDGRTHRLRDYRGRKVFLATWASW